MARVGVDPTRYGARQCTLSALLAIGATASTPVEVNGLHFVSIWRPASTGFTSFKFDISNDGVTWYRVKDKSNTEYTLTVDATAGAQFIDNLSAFAGATHIRVVPNAATSGTDKTVLLAFTAL